MRPLSSENDRNCWPQVVAGAEGLDLPWVPEMSAYRAVSDLRESLDEAQKSIDRNHAGDGVWMARASFCRHMVAVADSWAREIPAADDLASFEKHNAVSRIANKAHRLRLENERMRAAINSITCALENLKS